MSIDRVEQEGPVKTDSKPLPFNTERTKALYVHECVLDMELNATLELICEDETFPLSSLEGMNVFAHFWNSSEDIREFLDTMESYLPRGFLNSSR